MATAARFELVSVRLTDRQLVHARQAAQNTCSDFGDGRRSRFDKEWRCHCASIRRVARYDAVAASDTHCRVVQF